MSARAPTQKEIAERLGVSQALVSRALSGRAGEIGASEKTVARIRKAAEKWNYQPNTAALALLGAATRTIGVVVRDFEDPYFGRLIGALQAEAARRGLSLLLTGCTADDLRSLRRHKVDALVLAGSDFEPEGLAAFTASEDRLPVVQIGGGKVRSGVVQVRTDDEEGILQVAAHLAELGHRELGFVGRRKPSNVRRAQALRNALKATGLPVRAGNFLEVDGSHDAVAEQVLVRVRRTGEASPTAWVAAEDVLAITLLAAFQQDGLRVPDDISLVGIDDIPMASMIHPALTTLRQPVVDMATAAIALLSEEKPLQSIVLPSSLIIRKTTAAMKKGALQTQQKNKKTQNP